ncbi:polyprenyl synthetase family protein [Helicobacter sp. 13S00477-4]|uniref:polyprenyl synthetase family protein n=1 Tax=Helicobacter sp. 13S00477-4 TaxID=1905759 RepID=UPI000BA79AD3|nr:polyprenyl synthetase family protein [Helicobacter sp. 13S00477-4]PAF50599.1 hypothetical protein BKH44_07505 [Helicobacter sp. 13S00477-4]
MLGQIEKKIQNFMQEIANINIEQLFSQIISGKMLRSKLILAICPHHPKVIELCAIIEMIQSASLLHDDVIDESEIRRGKPSLNASFGNKNAIMLGDVLYSKAFFELTKMDQRIAQSISNAVIELSRGEIDDVYLSENFNPSQEKYFQMLRDKTASLIGASAECGAILAGLDDVKYKNYGINLGIAFQIIDDVLDVKGDRETLGKPSMRDFKEGKTTLPYIFLYENLPENQKKILVSYFRQDSPKIDEWLKEHFNKYNIIHSVIDQAIRYGDLAIASIKDQKNHLLEEIVDKMIYREF